MILAVTWWCHRVEEPWNWHPRPIIGVWVFLLAIAVPYTRALYRRQPADPRRRHYATMFGLGLSCLWLASDWPLGQLGASYLASVHMFDYMIYILGAAPLLMLGTPEWMARAVVRRLHAYRVLRWVGRPVPAGLGFNIILVVAHAPITVDHLRATPGGSFILDMAWLASGLLVWLPLHSPLPEQRIRTAPGQMIYLWIAMGIVDTVPSSFLLFASYPLYRTYELSTRVYGISATSDQQFAGVIMKLGGMFFIFPVTAAIFYQAWVAENPHLNPRRRSSTAGHTAAPAPNEVRPEIEAAPT